MTREEASFYLANMDRKYMEKGMSEALDMAIQALSQEPQCTEQPCLGTLCRYYKEPCRVKNELNVELNELKPCTDAVSRQAVLDEIEKWVVIELQYTNATPRLIKRINELPSVTQKSGKWIALVARPMTNEEREYYSEQLDYCDGDAAVYDCPLPEEGQDVLITTCTGGVLIDTFFNDYDGCGFEGYDIEDVKAWMPLPKPYEPQERSDKE